MKGNYVKFTTSGCVTLRVAKDEKRRWRFEVEDTGPGIPALRPRIFEPFQQGPEAKGKGGTGLGLAIGERQVKIMGAICRSARVLGKELFFPSPSTYRWPALVE
jgi:signal transduction histidine kinase